MFVVAFNTGAPFSALGPSCTSSASNTPGPPAAPPPAGHGCRLLMLSAIKMRISASVKRRELLSKVVSPACGRRMMSIAPTGEFCTNGNCSFLAPVSPFSIKPLKVALEMPVHAGFAVPVGGNPPVQLPAGKATQFAAGPVPGAAGQPPPALGTYGVPVYPAAVAWP